MISAARPWPGGVLHARAACRTMPHRSRAARTRQAVVPRGERGRRRDGHGGAARGADAAAALRRRPASAVPIGAGGKPMSLAQLARLACSHGGGYPVRLLDLAAVDQNTAVVLRFARAQGWSVRPALKSFRSPGLTSYLLSACRARAGSCSTSSRSTRSYRGAAGRGPDVRLPADGW